MKPGLAVRGVLIMGLWLPACRSAPAPQAESYDPPDPCALVVFSLMANELTSRELVAQGLDPATADAMAASNGRGMSIAFPEMSRCDPDRKRRIQACFSAASAAAESPRETLAAKLNCSAGAEPIP